MSLDIIADLLKGSQDDVLVACDMLEEMSLDLVAAKIRKYMSSSVLIAWSLWVRKRQFVKTTRPEYIQWNNFLTSIQTEGS